MDVDSTSLSETPQALNIGIIRTSSIGDVVLATACLDFLEKSSLNFKVIWLGKAPTLQILKASFENQCFINFKEKNLLSTLEDLPSIDLLIDLQGSFKTKIFLFCFKFLKKKPVFSVPKKRFLRTFFVYLARIFGRKKIFALLYKTQQKQFESMLLTLKKSLLFLKVPLQAEIAAHPTLRIKIDLTDESSYPFFSQIKEGRWLAVSAGASFASKKMPIDKMAQILEMIQTKLSHTKDKSLGLIFLGDKNDAPDAEKTKNLIDWKGPILDLTGSIDLLTTAKVISLTKGIISNDSGLAHIAQALNKPAFVLFGPTIESFGFGPWQEKSQSFSIKLGCRPCSKHGQKPCRFKDQKCFYDINSFEVAASVIKVLSGEMT